MDAYPMILRSAYLQIQPVAYFVCVTCGKETEREEDYSFNCEWCGTTRITPNHVQGVREDGHWKIEKADWGYLYVE